MRLRRGYFNHHDHAMGARFDELWLWITVLVLLVTGALKVVSLYADQTVVPTRDPVFPFLNLTSTMGFAAVLEFLVASFLVIVPSPRIGAWGVLWLVAVFLIYRLGLMMVPDVRAPCNCLGTLSVGWLGGEASERVSELILVYLAASSFLVIMGFSFRLPNPFRNALER